MVDAERLLPVDDPQGVVEGDVRGGDEAAADELEQAVDDEHGDGLLPPVQHGAIAEHSTLSPAVLGRASGGGRGDVGFTHRSSFPTGQLGTTAAMGVSQHPSPGRS